MSTIEIEWPENYTEARRQQVVECLVSNEYYMLATAIRVATLPEPLREKGWWVVRRHASGHPFLRRWDGETWRHESGNTSLEQDWVTVKFIEEL